MFIFVLIKAALFKLLDIVSSFRIMCTFEFHDQIAHYHEATKIWLS